MRLIKDGGMKQSFYGGTLAFVMIMCLSVVEPGHPGTILNGDQPDALPPSEERLQQGKALYEGVARCMHCHGQTAVRRPLTKQELFSIIQLGVPGTSHMPFKHLLSDEEIWSIVYYQLHGICKHGCTD
ncbi:cytochrome c [Nitrospira sp. MA-1]|nr:cytochrome c [Nitrospira sp. MA-1]